MFDLWSWISDLEGNDLKFIYIQSLRMALMHMPMHFNLIGWEIQEKFAKCWPWRSSQKCEKLAKTLWPWPDDLGTHIVCWPCLSLSTMYVWSFYLIIQRVKLYVKGLTLNIWPWWQKVKIPSHSVTFLKVHILTVSRKSENGEGVKMLWLTPGMGDFIYLRGRR